ncbi:TP53 regulating kinase isoform X2 [Oratosquilla oratoria]
MEIQRCLLVQGAEGRVYTGSWLGKDVVIKERFKKKYRHPVLDTNITKERIKAEARALTRCRMYGIRTPTVYFIDWETNEIIMELIPKSETVRNFIYSAVKRNVAMNSTELLGMARRIGAVIARMHSNHIIHGDLTTSNLLLVEPYQNSDIILIDFGLSYMEEKPEDKAVDLYVLERAILSTHPNSEEILSALLEAYGQEGGKGSQEVIKRLEDVRSRGRKKLCFG